MPTNNLHPRLYLPEGIRHCYPDLTITGEYGTRRYVWWEEHERLIVYSNDTVLDTISPIWPVGIYRELHIDIDRDEGDTLLTGQQWIRLAWLSHEGYLLRYIWDYAILADPHLCLCYLSAVGYPVTDGSLVSRWITDVISFPGNIIPTLPCIKRRKWNPGKRVCLDRLQRFEDLQLIEEGGDGTWRVCTPHAGIL